MKCDELTPIELECNMGKDINGVVHREPWKAYDIDEVDAAIAELKEQIEVLKHQACKCNDTQSFRHCAFLPDHPKPRRATNRELARWLAQGNGEWGISKFGVIEKAQIDWFYGTGYERETLQSEMRVRKWSDTEWHDPTVDYMGLEDK